MFPLSTVVHPTAALPLHVFEPRYRQMVREVLEGRGEFGVVLIERGSEVGGGDVRTDVGTLARILEADELPDGRWVLLAAGVERLRVREWLPDHPYPLADVEPWPDPPPSAELAPLITRATASLRLLAATLSETGRTARFEIELPDDPVLATYRLCAGSPLGPADQQRLLAAPSPETRLELLVELLEDVREVLVAQMRLDEGGGPAQD